VRRIAAILAILTVVVIAVVIGTEEHGLDVIKDDAQQLAAVSEFEGSFKGAMRCLAGSHHKHHPITQSADNARICNRRKRWSIEYHGVEFGSQVRYEFFHLVQRKKLDRILRDSACGQEIEVFQAAHKAMRTKTAFRQISEQAGL